VVGIERDVNLPQILTDTVDERRGPLHVIGGSWYRQGTTFHEVILRVDDEHLDIHLYSP
jgi:hypothetical protein